MEVESSDAGQAEVGGSLASEAGFQAGGALLPRGRVELNRGRRALRQTLVNEEEGAWITREANVLREAGQAVVGAGLAAETLLGLVRARWALKWTVAVARG